MKHVIALALAATAFGSLTAHAQTTVIEERRPAVVIEQQAPVESSTTVQKSEPVLGGVKNTTTTQTTGAGVDCVSRTEKTDTLLGSKTVQKRDCY